MAADLLMLALVAGTLWLVFATPRLVRGEGWTLFRALWPSWRFFEAIAPVPMLSARAVESGARSGPWRPVLGRPRRAWYSVILNADGNLNLAYASVVERLVQELDRKPVDAVADLISYQLVQQMVEKSLEPHAPDLLGYQFKLEDPDTGEEMFVSALHSPSRDHVARSR